MVEKAEVKKILYITMSNLGDAMMGLPAFDLLRREYPLAKITVIAGPRTKCVFEYHPEVDELIVFDKHAPLRQKIGLFFKLRRAGFDCVVDLRNTFYRFGVSAKYKNPAFNIFPAWIVHSSQKHLYKAFTAIKGLSVDEEAFIEVSSRRNPSFIAPGDHVYIEELLKNNNVSKDEELALVAPGARSSLKRWHKEGYAQVISEIRKKYGYKVVVIGDAGEAAMVNEIIGASGSDAINLCGKMDFGQLCSLIQRSKLVICNDSGVLHIASYLDRFVVGIYGPSDHKEFGPWSKRCIAVRKNILCSPCGKATCRYDEECIKTVTPYDVLLAVRLVLEGRGANVHENRYKRILVVRTDRIGDVLISTPVVKALRDNYPMSYIAIMVSLYTKDLVEGNPYLDSVIILDKDKKHKGLFATLGLSRSLKNMKFDVAIILHPTVRVHLICFLAGIKERIGYDRKAPYFLTTVIKHTKQYGARHESEYNFDLLKPLGILEVNKELYMPIKAYSENLVREVLKDAGVTPRDRLVVIHPASSCLSRRWPISRFAQLIDRLAMSFRVKVLIVSDSIHSDISKELVSLSKTRPIDMSGRFDLSGLASLFKRCALVISNDSGPVHMAVAVKTPVISIFGRNQPGLGPARWRPLGVTDIFLHKNTDCSPCLAQDCVNNFKCLEAISVDEVFACAGRLLNRSQQKSINNNLTPSLKISQNSHRNEDIPNNDNFDSKLRS
ncbi:MAG: lipopolysaccharide heptosyltransferase II [Candidatus Omnitrophica bacterium CG_4_10_14_0_2_um_filter_44_9]|nr:MAG: lipopolysaccharide heptosyltransferase II [Candidatus Omnitrophica bacterium CG_4_10_14_0_2_um_filter_44_9]